MPYVYLLYMPINVGTDGKYLLASSLLRQDCYLESQKEDICQEAD